MEYRGMQLYPNILWKFILTESTPVTWTENKLSLSIIKPLPGTKAVKKIYALLTLLGIVQQSFLHLKFS